MKIRTFARVADFVDDERRLGEIHLARDRLHRFGRQPRTVAHDRQLIACIARLRKHIDDMQPHAIALPHQRFLIVSLTIAPPRVMTQPLMMSSAGSRFSSLASLSQNSSNRLTMLLEYISLALRLTCDGRLPRPTTITPLMSITSLTHGAFDVAAGFHRHVDNDATRPHRFDHVARDDARRRPAEYLRRGDHDVGLRR